MQKEVPVSISLLEISFPTFWNGGGKQIPGIKGEMEIVFPATKVF
jgi:hypothetical protein